MLLETSFAWAQERTPEGGPLLRLAEEHPEIFEGAGMPVNTPCNDGSALRDCFAYSLTEAGLSASFSASIAALCFTLLYAWVALVLYWMFKNRARLRQRLATTYKSKKFRAGFIFYILWLPIAFNLAESGVAFLMLVAAPLLISLSCIFLFKWYQKGV